MILIGSDVAVHRLEDLAAGAFLRALSPADRPGRDSARPVRVLVVEDEFLVAWQLDNALREAGYAVTGVVGSAEEALQSAEEACPDVVLMDVRLSGECDGVDLAIELQKRFGLRAIFASAHADDMTRSRARDAHPLAWISKPYTPQDILKELKKLRD